MARKIIVTISANIALETNEKEEIIVEKIENLDTDFEYDYLQGKLESLLLNRIRKEMKDLKDVEIHDIGYWD